MADKKKDKKADKNRTENEKIPGAVKSRGDRTVQIFLLILIAAGIGTILWQNFSGGKPGSGAPGSPAGRGGYSAPAGGSPGKPGAPPSGGPGGAPEGASAIAVETVPALRKDVSQYIRVNGDVVLENQVEIYSDTNGRLVSRTIAPGGRVSAGQLIAQVDPSLPGQNFSVSAVRSTIAGTVISLPLHVGDKVTTQTPLAVIGNLGDMLIQTYIPEKYVGGLSLGLMAEVNFDAIPGASFTAVISEISPIMDTATRTLSVKLKMPQEDSRIRPGMFASMKLITRESKNTISIPTQALLSYYGDPSVYVVSSENRAERRMVRKGLSTDEEVEITEGLAPGDLVITQGQSKLTDGTLVRSVATEAN